MAIYFYGFMVGGKYIDDMEEYEPVEEFYFYSDIPLDFWSILKEGLLATGLLDTRKWWNDW